MEVGEEKNETKIKTTPDNELEPTSVDLVVQLGEDYAEYVNIDTAVERKKYADTVDEMLTKLDEFCGLVDMIRSDTALCLTRTVPEIHEKCHEMEQIFTKIDKLEAFVALVRRDVGLMEDHVTRAEDEMGTLSGIMKILGSISMPSFISPKKSAKAKTDSRPAERDLTYRPPEIFDTDKFFPMSSHTSPVVVQIPGKVPIEGGGGGLT